MAIKVQSYNLDAISYLPLYAPGPLTYRVEVMNPNSNTGAIILRTDATDPNTAITLLPGESKLFESIKNGPPYNPGTILIYAIMVSGTGTVKTIAH